MSAIIKLSSKLPGDEEINGLDAKASHFLESETPVLCLAWVVTKHITKYLGDDGAAPVEVPTVEVRRVEPIGTPGNVPQHVQDLAAELYEARTGRNPLPIGELLAPAGDVHVIQTPTLEDEQAAEAREADEAGLVMEPRLNRGPERVGEIFTFERKGAEA